MRVNRILVSGAIAFVLGIVVIVLTVAIFEIYHTSDAKLVTVSSLQAEKSGVASRNERAETLRLAVTFDGEPEVRNWDGTRVDLVTDRHAIEVDYAPKWAEAIGQALYYAEVQDKSPMVILLVQDMEKERQFVYRCQTVCVARHIALHIEVLPQAK